LVHPGSSEVKRFETRSLTGAAIKHLNAGCLSQLPFSSRKAQRQNPSSHPDGRLYRVEYLSRMS
jgi:hypothetical protein